MTALPGQLARPFVGWAILLATLSIATPLLAQPASKASDADRRLPTEIPADFKPVTDKFDYTRREAMIPMRDGAKLFTVIFVPKGAANAPILLTRTPYDAARLTSRRGGDDAPVCGRR